MHLRFREIVTHARREGLRVIDRCNLTILAEQGVEVTASLPCYSRENVDRQRGDGVFEASIAGLKTLNQPARLWRGWQRADPQPGVQPARPPPGRGTSASPSATC